MNTSRSLVLSAAAIIAVWLASPLSAETMQYGTDPRVVFTCESITDYIRTYDMTAAGPLGSRLPDAYGSALELASAMAIPTDSSDEARVAEALQTDSDGPEPAPATRSEGWLLAGLALCGACVLQVGQASFVSMQLRATKSDASFRRVGFRPARLQSRW